MTDREAADIFVQNIKFVQIVAYEAAPTKSLVDDIVHDVFIFFVENAARWEYAPNRIQALLRKITLGIARDQWRKYVNNLPERLREIALYLQKDQTSVSETTEPYSNLEEKVLALRNCLGKLSPGNRELVELLYYGDLHYSDIQEKTGTSLDAIYQKMFRIRTALFQCITKTLAMEVNDV